MEYYIVQMLDKLERHWQIYSRSTLLVMDEVGYMQLNHHASELLFQLIWDRYEHGNVILTNDKYFSDWGELQLTQLQKQGQRRK